MDFVLYFFGPVLAAAMLLGLATSSPTLGWRMVRGTLSPAMAIASLLVSVVLALPAFSTAFGLPSPWWIAVFGGRLSWWPMANVAIGVVALLLFGLGVLAAIARRARNPE